MDMSSNITNKSKCDSTFDCFPVEFAISKVIAWTELVLIITLNTLVIVLILWNRKTNRMYFFVMHLAISDLMVGLTYLLPTSVMFEIGWINNIHSCRFTNYIGYASLYASSAMLVILSMDRLYVISCPISATKRGKWFRYISVATAWNLALILALPLPIVASEVTLYKGRYFCDTIYYDLVIRQIFMTLFTSCVLFVPAVIIIICCVAIVIILWRKARDGISASSDESYERSLNRELSMKSKVLPRAKKRSIEMTLLVVIAFILSWSPICFNYILNVYDVVELKGGPYFILNAMAPLNSAVNPVVFLVFTRCMGSKKNNKNISISLKTTRSSITRSHNEHGECRV